MSWWICFLQSHSFSLHKMLTDGLEWCGLLVMFLSAVWTLILTAPIHCRGSIGELHFSKSDEETNSLGALRVSIFSVIFIIGWTVPLKYCMHLKPQWKRQYLVSLKLMHCEWKFMLSLKANGTRGNTQRINYKPKTQLHKQLIWTEQKYTEKKTDFSKIIRVHFTRKYYFSFSTSKFYIQFNAFLAL